MSADDKRKDAETLQGLDGLLQDGLDHLQDFRAGHAGQPPPSATTAALLQGRHRPVDGKQAADREAYRTDPLVYAVWNSAVLYLDRHGIVDRHEPRAMDDHRVVELKDWLISIYEAGAQRSTRQPTAVDESLAVAAGLAPPPTIMMCPDCPKAKAFKEAMP